MTSIASKVTWSCELRRTGWHVGVGRWLVSLGLVALWAGVVAGRLGLVPVALATHCGQTSGCIGPDTTYTSALVVTHAKDTGAGLTPVEPNTGETLNLAANYSNVTPICTIHNTYYATVVVTWTDGSGWSVSCTSGCGASGVINSVNICDTGSCGSSSNGWSYKLVVDLDDIDGEGFSLSDVVYTTTSVSNGNLVDVGQCSEGSSVSPTSQTFSATDATFFECAFSCDATGASMTITYQ